MAVENFVVCIPARMRSSRLPGKPLAMIEGKPLIHWTIEAAIVAARNMRHRVGVFTPDEEIVHAVKDLGVGVIHHPEQLPGEEYVGGFATGTAPHSGLERIMSTLPEEWRGMTFVDWQCEWPCVDPMDVRRLGSFDGSVREVTHGTLYCDLLPDEENDPNAVKVVLDGGKAVWFSRVYPVARPESRQNVFRHVGVYVIKPSIKWKKRRHEKTWKTWGEYAGLEGLEQIGNRWWPLKAKDDLCRFAVDTQEDLDYLRSHPELLAVNRMKKAG